LLIQRRISLQLSKMVELLPLIRNGYYIWNQICRGVTSRASYNLEVVVHIVPKAFSVFLLVALGIAAWACGLKPVLAGGGGGEDLGSAQQTLNGACALFTVGQDPCPQFPTISQIVLEIAGLIFDRPKAVRQDLNAPGSATYASNVVTSSPIDPSSLMPLAFIGAPTSQRQATPTQLYDPAANSFFYAVATKGTVGGFSQPQTLNLFYDYLLRTIPVFIKGQTVAKISLPLVVLQPDGKERAVCGSKGCPASVATLNVTASCTGGATCLKGEVVGDFGTGIPSYKAEDLGITVTATFGKSAISALPHATFIVQVPFVVTTVNDEPYFSSLNNPLTGTPVFAADQMGNPLPGVPGAFIGIPPYAAPACAGPAGTKCPDLSPQTTFGYCASFSNNFTGPVGNPAPAVAAFLQLATNGETLVSAPLPPIEGITPVCSF
jgi:hypothetical protein